MPNQSGTSYYLTDKDVENAFRQCLASEYIKENKQYLSVCNATFVTINKSDIVNAYCATLSDQLRDYLYDTIPAVPWGNYSYILTMTAGMLRWATALAHVCEYIDRTHRLTTATKMMSWMADRATQFSIGSDFTQRFLDEFGVQCDGCREERVRMYGLGILIGVIGHEMGHACLCHAYQDSQNSISRNNERSADLFASSIVQSIGNGYVGAAATVIMDISFIWLFGPHSAYRDMIDMDEKAKKFNTHPVSIERVNSFIDSFNAVLEHAPITAKMLRKLAAQGNR